MDVYMEKLIFKQRYEEIERIIQKKTLPGRGMHVGICPMLPRNRKGINMVQMITDKNRKEKSN